MRRIRTSHGFTLIEVLVALAVVGVAVTVFFSLFTSSLGLAESSRNQSIAATLAEEQLVAVCQNPGKYEWGLKTAQPGQLVLVKASGPQDQSGKFTAPSLTSISEQDKNLYDRFGWKVYAKIPSDKAAYVEVIVAVEWKEAGRDKVFTVTSTLSRALVTALRVQSALREEA